MSDIGTERLAPTAGVQDTQPQEARPPATRKIRPRRASRSPEPQHDADRAEAPDHELDSLA